MCNKIWPFVKFCKDFMVSRTLWVKFYSEGKVHDQVSIQQGDNKIHVISSPTPCTYPINLMYNKELVAVAMLVLAIAQGGHG
jgi:hypothetical protein